MKTPADSTTYAAPASPHDVVGNFLLEDGDGLSVDDGFHILSLDCAIEFVMGEIILEHIDHVVEVNEEVICDDNSYFARFKSSPGNKVPNKVKSVHSDLHHHVLRMQPAQHKKMLLSIEWGGAESPHLLFFNLCR